jgi:hypothetical protein
MGAASCHGTNAALTDGAALKRLAEGREAS